MIVTCLQCQTRLQLDEAKIPANVFNVRCPKCGHGNSVQPPAGDSVPPVGEAEAATNMISDESSPLARARVESATPAPAFRPDDVEENSKVKVESDVSGEEIVRLLTALLRRGAPSGVEKAENDFSENGWETRRALVCTALPHREEVAGALAASRYEVYVAANTTEAIKRMREDRMNVIVLDPEFDRGEQGAAFINRELAQLRPVDRRRLFVVQLSPTARTGDSHAAFVSHVNLIVNTNDLSEMSAALERALRDFNELYRDFNKAVAACSA